MQMSLQKRISFDTETTHIAPRFAEIVGYSFAWKEGESYYIPVRAPEGETRLDPKQTLAALRPILENPAIEKVGQNLKYDMIVLRTAGVEMRGCGVRHDGRQLPCSTRASGTTTSTSWPSDISTTRPPRSKR